MIKFVNPRFSDLVFVLSDEGAADRYRAWNGGHPEVELIEWARETFADEGGAFVDIGANCGLWTLRMASAFRRVYAFEPKLDTFARLAAGAALSNVPRQSITMLNLALGGETGTATLRSVGSDAFDASVVQYGDEVSGSVVPVQRLSDTLFDERIALVKIDVEGYEFEVLRGAERFLRAAGLPPILFEAWDAERGQRPLADVRALLESYGYNIEKINWPEEYLAVRRSGK